MAVGGSDAEADAVNVAVAVDVAVPVGGSEYVAERVSGAVIVTVRDVVEVFDGYPKSASAPGAKASVATIKVTSAGAIGNRSVTGMMLLSRNLDTSLRRKLEN